MKNYTKNEWLNLSPGERETLGTSAIIALAYYATEDTELHRLLQVIIHRMDDYEATRKSILEYIEALENRYISKLS